MTTLGCTAPTGHVVSSTDCYGKNAPIHPNAAEVCNGIDQDCDRVVDEVETVTFYRDADGDSFGGPTCATKACAGRAGHVTSRTDCNDRDRAISPVAQELCEAKDKDCEASTDEGAQKTFYGDVDTDRFGETSLSILAFAQPTGHVTLAGNCNDDLSYVHPGPSERCNSNETGKDASFGDLVGACTDHDAQPLELTSESDDRCVASALSR